MFNARFSLSVVMARCSLLTVLLLGLAVSATPAAEIDTVYRHGDAKGVGGEITSVTRDEIVVTQKVGNKEEHIPANEIDRVEFQTEPAELGLARSNEASGNFDEALSGYQQALAAATASNVKAEIEFLIARTLSKMASQDSKQQAPALEKLKAFAETHRDNYRFYAAQKLLAETSLAAGDSLTADSAFRRLEDAPWPELKMAGKIGEARTLLAQDKTQEAKAIFDEVASAKASTPAEKSNQLEAMLGQARCLQKQNQTADATKVLDQVINQATADDSRLLATAYLTLGNCYAGDDQKAKDAILAFLHVDVIPQLAQQSEAHAEALFHLSKLWPSVGQPARGAEASAKLQQDYPQSSWTQKLADGS